VWVLKEQLTYCIGDIASREPMPLIRMPLNLQVRKRENELGTEA
jgi:hypothetical protein